MANHMLSKRILVTNGRSANVLLTKLWFVISMTLTLHANGERKISSIIICKDSADQRIIKSCFSNQTAKDSLQSMNVLKVGVNCLRADGYVAASIDSFIVIKDTLFAWLYLGERYRWAELKTGNVSTEFIPATFRNNSFEGIPISSARISKITEGIIEKCENTGYPFAQVKLDSFTINNERMVARLNLDKGRYTLIDSVRINGPMVVTPVYLYNYLGIRPGDAYNESLVRRIDTRLRELPFVNAVRPTSILFSEKYNRLDLFLEPKKASQFDGVIGLLPNADGQGKTSLTGEVHLKLQNSFKRGEAIELNWRQVPPRSQDLRFHVNYPFLFNTPLGVDAFINLYKRDTLYVDVDKNLGVIFTLKGNNFVKAFITNKQSNLQSTSGLENTTTLPTYADISVTGYGANFHFEELDYRLNPRRGIQTDFAFQIGTRTISKNQGINPVAYEGLDLFSTQYQAALSVNYYRPIKGRHVAAISCKSAFIYNDQLFDNELYRIGGLKSLRGFDEESIFASTFSILSVEYRYLTDINSFFFCFVNGAWYERNVTGGYLNDTPIGLGTGYNFQTKLGILSVSYALGRQQDQPFQLKSGKVHFGIVNYF